MKRSIKIKKKNATKQEFFMTQRTQLRDLINETETHFLELNCNNHDIFFLLTQALLSIKILVLLNCDKRARVKRESIHVVFH